MLFNNLFLKLYLRYKTVIKDNQIDLILYVAPADEEPNIKLFKAIIRAKEESKDEKSKSTLVQNNLTFFASFYYSKSF